MYDRGQQEIPMTAPVDPRHLRPLIRGLPDALKIHVQSLRERIQGAIDRNRQNPQGPAAHVMTWAEVPHSIVVHGHEMGWAEPSGGTEGGRKVRPASCKPRPERSRTRGGSDRDYDPGRDGLWRKALALGAPRAVLHGQSADDIRELVELLEGKAREQREAPAAPPPREEKRSPFAALREELEGLKN
ncbi:uncharacterized protein ACIBXB_006110 [Morphnus guianensis]